jgi:ferredoxin-thioredoxin reductase catalytic subunit
MIRVTDNKEVKETVLAGLKHNKDKYGKRYCPCSLIRDEDTVCMCKEFREMERRDFVIANSMLKLKK